MAEEKSKKEEAVKTPAEEISGAEPVVSVEEGKKRKKSSKRQVLRGRATIQCTYNNTIVTLSDANGAVLGWSSAGHLGFKGAKKSTPYAATQIVASVAEKVKKYGLQELEVFLRGVGSGREASVRALANNGFSILSIKDLTPIPHNGCRPKRPRRI
jgi:small subunit ribosomal protein S11